MPAAICTGGSQLSPRSVERRATTFKFGALPHVPIARSAPVVGLAQMFGNRARASNKVREGSVVVVFFVVVFLVVVFFVVVFVIVATVNEAQACKWSKTEIGPLP